MKLPISIRNNSHLLSAEILLLEGELLTVTSTDSIPFSVGDVVQCHYNEAQFESRILRIWNDRMYLFFPLVKDTKYAINLRREPRVKIHLSASVMDTNEKLFHLSQVRIIDVSILGFAFFTTRELNAGEHYTILPQSDQLPIKVEVIIRNKKEMENGFRYGAEIHHITNHHFQVLRKFVLFQQLKAAANENVQPLTKEIRQS